MALDSLDCTRDKGLSNIRSMIHLVTISSLKYPAADHRIISLLSQTAPSMDTQRDSVSSIKPTVLLASKVQKSNKG
ncbi:hypothetical protein TNCV_4480101 [Trichonephila clavipes]|nr:hypothetical protein TNCV_4480101 [Trichonephila clavipes]